MLDQDSQLVRPDVVLTVTPSNAIDHFHDHADETDDLDAVLDDDTLATPVPTASTSPTAFLDDRLTTKDQNDLTHGHPAVPVVVWPLPGRRPC